MLLNAFFSANSEYHIYFTPQLVYNAQNIQIWTHFSMFRLHLGTDGEKIDFLSNNTELKKGYITVFIVLRKLKW
jgi:hypothetical protein